MSKCVSVDRSGADVDVDGGGGGGGGSGGGGTSSGVYLLLCLFGWLVGWVSRHVELVVARDQGPWTRGTKAGITGKSPNQLPSKNNKLNRDTPSVISHGTPPRKTLVE